MVAFSSVIQAAIIPAGAVCAVFLHNHVEGGGPGAGGFLADALLFKVFEDFLGGIQVGGGEPAELREDRRALGFYVMLDVVGFLVECWQGLAENVGEFVAKCTEGV